jgi:hypothetical protein
MTRHSERGPLRSWLDGLGTINALNATNIHLDNKSPLRTGAPEPQKGLWQGIAHNGYLLEIRLPQESMLRSGGRGPADSMNSIGAKLVL